MTKMIKIDYYKETIKNDLFRRISFELKFLRPIRYELQLIQTRTCPFHPELKIFRSKTKLLTKKDNLWMIYKVYINKNEKMSEGLWSIYGICVFEKEMCKMFKLECCNLIGLYAVSCIYSDFK